MITERLQVLLTAEQRRRLEEEARQQGRSVASLVREAIDARYGTSTREQRLAAVDAIGAMSGGRFVPPEELNRMVEEERLENFGAVQGG
jgi:predicted transcriptional regulator